MNSPRSTLEDLAFWRTTVLSQERQFGLKLLHPYRAAMIRFKQQRPRLPVWPVTGTPARYNIGGTVSFTAAQLAEAEQAQSRA